MMDSVECPVTRENSDSIENDPRSPKSPLRTVSRNSTNSGRENTSSPRNDCASPEPNCAICLGKSKNKSFTDSCLHQFCFQCLLEWSKVKAECPLCKQGFKSIIHNVRSIEDYDQYHLRPVESGPWVNLINIDVGLFDVEAQRYQYRSALLNRSLRERALNLQRELINLREPRDAIPPQRTRRRRRGFASEHFRRNVYVQDIWVNYVANVNGARDILPMDFRTRPEELQRLTPWLNRELLALAMLTSASRIAHVLNLILSLVSCFHIRSQEFRQAIESHFNPYTDHFIHEFYTFARSGYDMIGFDENAHYVPRNNIALEVVHGVSSDSDDSDVICLSTSNDLLLPSEPEPPRSHSNQRSAMNIEIAPSSPIAGPSRAESFIEEVSDDCTCNSSHSEADSGSEFPLHRQPVAATNLPTGVQNQLGLSLQGIENSDESDSCMIVGYVKPRHERTPEIITLTSDISEPEIDEAEVIEDYVGPSDESAQHCSCESWMKPCNIHSSPVRESSGSEYLPSRERARRKKCKEKQKVKVKPRKRSSRGNEKFTGYPSKKRVNNAENSHARSEASCEECYAKRQKFPQKKRKHHSSSSSSSCSEHNDSSCRGYSSSNDSSSSSCQSSVCSSKACKSRISHREKLKAHKSRTKSRDRKANHNKYKSKSISGTYDYKASGTIDSSSSSRHRASKKIRSIIIRRSNADDANHPEPSKHIYKGKSTKMSNTKHSRSRNRHVGRQSSEVWNIVKAEYPSTSTAGYHYDYPHSARSYRCENSINSTKSSGRDTEKKENKHHDKRKQQKRTSSDAEGRLYAKKKRKRIISPESDSSDSN